MLGHSLAQEWDIEPYSIIPVFSSPICRNDYLWPLGLDHSEKD